MLRKILNQATFMLDQRMGNSPVSDLPEFDSESQKYFLSQLEKSNLYLEYGMGGSTVAAAKLHKKFVSVESDPFYLNEVKYRIGSNHNGTLLHADIGWTTHWGIPLFKFKTHKRIRKWKKYPQTPWSMFQNEKPDLILVDGRFRIATSLTAILQMSGSNYQLLVDDYFHRAELHIIENFAKLSNVVGRMAVFTPSNFSEREIVAAIEKHSLDYM